MPGLEANRTLTDPDWAERRSKVGRRRSTVRTSSLASSGPTLAPGHRVGRYIIARHLGTGGNGSVYAAQDPDLQRQVAIKVLHPRAGESRSRHARLLREAQVMARLSHANVVPIYDVGTTDDHVFLAMELLEAGTLGAWIDEARGSWRDGLELALAAGRGLAAAHGAGMVHRDFKPDNVLLGLRGEVRVTDFGLARAVSEEITGDDAVPLTETISCAGPVTMTNTVAGTAGYLAPEIFFGKPFDFRSDLFSFSVTLYETLYGERPFADPADGVTTIAGHVASVSAGRVLPAPPDSDVPSWLRKIVVRGLAVDPEQRWPSMDALMAGIEAGLRRGRRRWTRPAGAIAAIGAVGALIAVLAGGGEPVPAVPIAIPPAQRAPSPAPSMPQVATPAEVLRVATPAEVPSVPPPAQRDKRPTRRPPRRPSPRPHASQPAAPVVTPTSTEPPSDGIPKVRIDLDRLDP